MSAEEFDSYDMYSTPITIAFHLREFNVGQTCVVNEHSAYTMHRRQLHLRTLWALLSNFALPNQRPHCLLTLKEMPSTACLCCRRAKWVGHRVRLSLKHLPLPIGRGFVTSQLLKRRLASRNLSRPSKSRDCHPRRRPGRLLEMKQTFPIPRCPLRRLLSLVHLFHKFLWPSLHIGACARLQSLQNR